MNTKLLICGALALSACAEQSYEVTRKTSNASYQIGVDCTPARSVFYDASGQLYKIVYEPLDPRCGLQTQTVNEASAFEMGFWKQLARRLHMTRGISDPYDYASRVVLTETTY